MLVGGFRVMKFSPAFDSPGCGGAGRSGAASSSRVSELALREAFSPPFLERPLTRPPWAVRGLVISSDPWQTKTGPRT